MSAALAAGAILAAAVAALLSACSSSEGSTEARYSETSSNGNGEAGMQLHKVSTDEGLGLLDDPAVLVLDIRTEREFQAGTLPGAKNIVWGSSEFAQQIAALDRSQPILLFCRSGNRSGQSLPVFAELGFSTIYHLRDGIRRMPSERVVQPGPSD